MYNATHSLSDPYEVCKYTLLCMHNTWSYCTTNLDMEYAPTVTLTHYSLDRQDINVVF